MTVRDVEWKLPYTGWKAISIDENKVISLNLRDENNLIIYDEGDDEIYVDLQLPDWIRPLDAFPVGITTGRVLVADDWDVTWTIVCFKTTSWDNIKLLYADDGKLYIDNWTWTFKQIYLKGEVDALLQALREYIDAQLALKQDKLTAWKGINIDNNNEISNTLPGPIVSSSTPSDPVEWDQWYDTTNEVLKIYDWTQWNEVGWANYTAGDWIDITSNVIKNTLPWAIISATAPSNPSEWMLWYDSTNDVLKVYDGTNWGVVWDDSTKINTKTFVLTDFDWDTATAIYDYYTNGGYPIVMYGSDVYVWPTLSNNVLTFTQTQHLLDHSNSYTNIRVHKLTLTYDTTMQKVNNIWHPTPLNTYSYLAVGRNYTTPYTPEYAWSPTTKQYVDNRTYIPSEGLVVWDEKYANKWPCSEWFHVPTQSELHGVRRIWVDIWAWTGSSGTWVSQYLLMPYTWVRRNSDGSFTISWWNYWSCTWELGRQLVYYILSWFKWWFNDTSNQDPALASSISSTYWFPIRPFKDDYVAPDNSWTVLYDGSSFATWAWIFWNQTAWIISITDGTNLYTLSDKNCWATVVWTYGDTNTDENCWNLYQWWNNYGFSRSGTITTAAVSGSGIDINGEYWPENPYSSSTFYTSSQSWWAYGTGSIDLRWWVIPWKYVKPWNGRYLGNAYPFKPISKGTSWQILTKTSYWFDWETKYTLPTGTASSWYVLTKSGPSASNYVWKAWIWVSTQSNNNLSSWWLIWAWTQANYEALSSHSNTTVYIIV